MWLVVAGDLLLARRTSFEGRRFSAAGRTGQRRVALAILAEVELWDNAFTPETPVTVSTAGRRLQMLQGGGVNTTRTDHFILINNKSQLLSGV